MDASRTAVASLTPTRGELAAATTGQFVSRGQGIGRGRAPHHEEARRRRHDPHVPSGSHASSAIYRLATLGHTFSRHHSFEWSYTKSIALSIKRKVNADTLASPCSLRRSETVKTRTPVPHSRLGRYRSRPCEAIPFGLYFLRKEAGAVRRGTCLACGHTETPVRTNMHSCCAEPSQQFRGSPRPMRPLNRPR
jgi:hypothetical protein